MRLGFPRVANWASRVLKEPIMSLPTSRKLFVNLAVRDLKKSMAFFLGAGVHLQPPVHRRQGRLHDRE